MGCKDRLLGLLGVGCRGLHGWGGWGYWPATRKMKGSWLLAAEAWQYGEEQMAHVLHMP